MKSASLPEPRARLEVVFVSALPQIEKAIRLVVRRNGLGDSEAEEFASEAKLALVEGNYEILARFEGRSSLTTYLATVLQRRFLDWRRREWGRWRSSAMARRLGDTAVRLEALLYREGLAVGEACDVLVADPTVIEPRERLVELAQDLPVRESRAASSLDARPSGIEPATGSPEPDAQLLANATAERCQAAICDGVAALEPEDRVILRLHFEDEVSVADIARLLRRDQKKLYRHIESILKALKEHLSRRELSWPEVEALIESGQCHLTLSGSLREEDRAARASNEEAAR